MSASRTEMTPKSSGDSGDDASEANVALSTQLDRAARGWASMKLFGATTVIRSEASNSESKLGRVEVNPLLDGVRNRSRDCLYSATGTAQPLQLPKAFLSELLSCSSSRTNDPKVRPTHSVGQGTCQSSLRWSVLSGMSTICKNSMLAGNL